MGLSREKKVKVQPGHITRVSEKEAVATLCARRWGSMLHTCGLKTFSLIWHRLGLKAQLRLIDLRKSDRALPVHPLP